MCSMQSNFLALKQLKYNSYSYSNPLLFKFQKPPHWMWERELEHWFTMEESLQPTPSQSVWVLDGTNGFMLGSIISLDSDQVTVLTENEFGTDSTTQQVPHSSIHLAEDDSKRSYDDNCSLMYLNQATLLNNIRIRYQKDQIYVSSSLHIIIIIIILLSCWNLWGSGLMTSCL